MAASQSSLNDLSTSTNGSENAKRPGSLQITPSELNRPANLQRIAQRKAQIKTYPTRKKLEKLGVYSSCKVMFRIKERRRKKLHLFFLVNVKFSFSQTTSCALTIFSFVYTVGTGSNDFRVQVHSFA